MQHDITKNNNQQYIWLFVLVAFLGIGLRVARLGEFPLDDVEATLALSANHLAEGESVAISQPFYTNLTGFFFWLFEPTNFIARLLPMLIGSFLIFLPWLCGDLFTQRQKFLLSIALALDPALVAASKTVSSQLVAVVAIWLIVIFFLKQKPIPLGIGLAVFFMTGKSFIVGSIIICLTIFFLLLRDAESESIRDAFGKIHWKTVLVSFIVSYILLSSAFFTNPSGIGASFQDIGNSLKLSITLMPNINIGVMLIAFIVYEFFPILLSLIQIVSKNSQFQLKHRIFIWFGVFALLITVINPGRSALDLVWVSIPLWGLAVLTLESWIDDLKQINPVSLGVGGFIFLLVGFMLFNIVGAVKQEAIQQDLLIRLALLMGSLLLVGITYFFTSYTWDFLVGKNALIIGLGFYLVCYGLVMPSWHSAFMADTPESELWRQGSTVIDGERLLETIEDISEMNHGQRLNQEIAILSVNSPSVEWLLRNHNLTSSMALSIVDTPEMIISPPIEAPQWGAEYTGQDFRLGEFPNTYSMTFRDWMKWIIFHNMDGVTEQWGILWVRTDLFPGQSQGE